MLSSYTRALGVCTRALGVCSGGITSAKRLFCITGQICQNLGRAYEKMHAKPGSSRTATGAKGKRMRIKQMSTRLTKWKNVVAAKARVWSHQLIAGIRRMNLRIPLPQAVYGDGAA